MPLATQPNNHITVQPAFFFLLSLNALPQFFFLDYQCLFPQTSRAPTIFRTTFGAFFFVCALLLSVSQSVVACNHRRWASMLVQFESYALTCVCMWRWIRKLEEGTAFTLYPRLFLPSTDKVCSSVRRVSSIPWVGSKWTLFSFPLCNHPSLPSPSSPSSNASHNLQLKIDFRAEQIKR